MHTKGRKCEDIGRTPARQGCLRLLEPGRGMEQKLLTALRKHQPSDTLISNFWPPELWDNPFLLFKPPVCGTLLWQTNMGDFWEVIGLHPLCWMVISVQLEEKGQSHIILVDRIKKELRLSVSQGLHWDWNLGSLTQLGDLGRLCWHQNLHLGQCPARHIWFEGAGKSAPEHFLCEAGLKFHVYLVLLVKGFWKSYKIIWEGHSFFSPPKVNIGLFIASV